MEMNIFPLLSLPDVAARHVLAYTDVPALLNLSLSSKESYEFVKSANIRIHCLGFAKSGEVCQKIFVQRYRGSNSLHLIFDYTQQEPIRSFELNRHLFHVVSEERRRNIFWCTPTNFDEAASAFFSYFNDLFKCKTAHLEFDPYFIPSMPRLTNDPLFVERLESVYLFDYPVYRLIHGVTDEDTATVMRRFPNVKWLVSSMYGNLMSQPALPEYENVYLKTVSTLLSDVLPLNCRTITLKDSMLDHSHFNTFIKNWLAGTNRTLERFEYKFGYPAEEHYQIKDVMEGIEHKPWNPRLRRKNFRIVRHIKPDVVVDCSKGCDFVRADGTMATAFYHGKSFYFIVFHHPFGDE